MNDPDAQRIGGDGGDIDMSINVLINEEYELGIDFSAMVETPRGKCAPDGRCCVCARGTSASG